ncbi:hypothetical protein Tco_1094868 [Tanacetum coccineum]
MVKLHKNAYHGWIDEDVMDHIANVLEMIDLIYIPGVDSHQVRMKFFPLSLADDARRWWINEGEGKITVWEELVEKFFCKFYPDSYDGEEEMLDEGDNWGIDPLEFISRINSSFDKHMKMDGRTKKVLFDAWMNRNPKAATDPKAAADSLLPFLDKAKKVVPKDMRKNTPVKVGVSNCRSETVGS